LQRPPSVSFLKNLKKKIKKARKGRRGKYIANAFECSSSHKSSELSGY